MSLTFPVFLVLMAATAVSAGICIYFLMASRRTARRMRDLQTALEEKEHQCLQLREAMQRTQRLETVGRLAGGIAHDFNNLLTAILGYSEMTLDQLADRKDLAAMLNEVIKAGRNARDIIRRLLAFSRQGAAEFQPVPPHLVIQDMHKLLRAATPAFIEINMPPVTDCGWVMADPGRLLQLLFNLTVYSAGTMRHQKKGAISIGLSPHAEQEQLRQYGIPDGDYLCLTVSGTGGGITSGDCAGLFTPFAPVHQQAEDGGMSLVTAQAIVTAHKGFIKAESAPEIGTAFHIFLPRLQT